MRVMLKVSIPVEVGNAAIKDGSLPKKIQSILTESKPEAAYFSVNEKGERTAFLFLDLADPSKMVSVGEPWFLAFNARVEVTPAMTIEDLKKAGADMEAVVKKYAS